MTASRGAAVCLASLLLLIAGCAVDQEREVALYRDVLDARIPRVPPYGNGEPLSLRRAMALANQSDESLGLRGEEYVQSLISKNRAVAAFLPTVSFQPSFTLEQRARDSGSSGTGPGGTGIGTGGGGSSGATFGMASSAGGGSFRTAGQVAYRTEAPLVGNLNLFRGYSDVANLRAADAIVDQRRAFLLDVQATILLNVAQVYYQVLRSERFTEVIRNTLRVQEARLADVKQQFRNGWRRGCRSRRPGRRWTARGSRTCRRRATCATGGTRWRCWSGCPRSTAR